MRVFFLAPPPNFHSLFKCRSCWRHGTWFPACHTPTVSFPRKHYFQQTLVSSSSSLPSSLHREPALSPENAAEMNSLSRLSAEAFARLAPMVLLKKALRQYTLMDNTLLTEGVSNHLITREKFDEFCRLSNVQDSHSALQDLHEAAIVISLDKGRLVHLRPVQYVKEVEIVESFLSEKDTHVMNAQKNYAELVNYTLPACFLLTGSQQRIDELAKKEAAMRERLHPAIAKAARWRRLIWSAALLYTGMQLAAIAHLSFVEFDWDVMEPITYCLSIGTALLFLLYFVRYGEQHSYSDFDRRYLPKKVRKYAPKDFNWEEYEKVCTELVEAQKILENLREWAKTH